MFNMIDLIIIVGAIIAYNHYSTRVNSYITRIAKAVSSGVDKLLKVIDDLLTTEEDKK